MKIRYAKNNDFDFLIEGLEENRVLENRDKKDVKARKSDKKEFREAIRKKSIRIIEEYGRPIAFLYFRTDFKVMYVYDKFFWVDLVFVSRKHRGKGLGRILYKDAIKIAKKKGFKKIIVDVFDANKNSVNFHRKLVFDPIYTIYRKKI